MNQRKCFFFLFFCLFKKYLFLIDWWLVYNIGLISIMHQHELTPGVHTSPPPEPPSHLPPPAHSHLLGYSRGPVWAPRVTQQVPTGCLFTHAGAHASTLLSPRISPSPSSSPSVSISLFSMSTSPQLPCEYTHQYHPSRFHIHVLIYAIYFSLTHFSLCNRL